MELIYTNQDYGNQIKQANQAISDLSVYEFEKYFKQLKKIKRVATLKSHWAAIVHALKITHKKRLIESEKFLELIEFLEEFKTSKASLNQVIFLEKNKMEIYQVTFDFKDDEFNESNLIYEATPEEALLRAWNNLRYPCDKEDIPKYGTVEICKYSDKLQSVIEGKTKSFVFNLVNTEIAKILRGEGWRSDGELSCVSCELYPNGLKEYELDEDGYCPDCKEEK